MVNVKPVTLYDVAEYAGVSYQTVSRVVNQASHVSAKTREKVEAAMAELNYIPNRVAQQLAGKQSLLIGVATSSLALHAPSQIVAAIKSRADQLGASVVVSMVERSGVEACKAAVHNLLAQRVSGLIINYPLDDQDAIAVEAACTNVPALFLDVSDQTPINSIIFSHEDGTRLGVEHLVALGHQQIALLAGPLSSVSARLRLAGWHKYLTRNQIQPIAEREGDWSAMSGFQQTMQMLNEGIVPTAMLVANDQMALGAMRAITESGLRVGADISVVGYDDTEDSSCYIPPLTTIKQDFRLLGQTSVDRLLQLSQGQAVKGNQLLPVSLVKRKTTLVPNTQTASPRALADSLMQLARQFPDWKAGSERNARLRTASALGLASPSISASVPCITTPTTCTSISPSTRFTRPETPSMSRIGPTAPSLTSARRSNGTTGLSVTITKRGSAFPRTARTTWSGTRAWKAWSAGSSHDINL